MNNATVIVDGTLKPDGTLELDEKPPLPAGRVRVTLQAESVLPEGEQPDSAVPMSFVEMAEALRKIGAAVPEEAALLVDPDDYPLFCREWQGVWTRSRSTAPFPKSSVRETSLSVCPCSI